MLVAIEVLVSDHPVLGFIVVVESGGALRAEVEIPVHAALTDLRERCDVQYLNYL